MKRERIICADSSFFQGEERNLYVTIHRNSTPLIFSPISRQNIYPNADNGWKVFFFRREANLMISRGVQLALNLNRFFEILKQLTTIITSLPQTVSSLYKLYISLQTI